MHPAPPRPARWAALAVLGAAALGAALTTPARAQLLPFGHYSPESEVRALPSAEVHGILQDRSGYLWVVVYSSGLVRYDGVEMELYDESDGLRDVALWEVLQDRAGRLWVASNGGLVVSERPLAAYGGRARVAFQTEVGGVPLLDVGVDRNQMVIDASGRVWVGTDGLGVVRYTLGVDRARADTIRLTGPGTEPPSVRTLVRRADGTILAGLGDGRILAAPRGRLPFRPFAALGEELRAPTVLFESPGGGLWVGDREGGVWRIDGPSALVRVVEPMGSAVVSMEWTARGELAVATDAHGLVVVPQGAGEPARFYTRRNGLLSDGLHDLLRDREGNLWVGQSGGLSKLRRNAEAFTAYTARSLEGERPLLPAAAVGAVAPAPLGACDLWVGTTEGVGCIAQGPPVAADRLDAEDGLTNVYVNALVPDAGRLWIGTVRGVFALSEPGAPPVPGAQSVRTVRLNGRVLRLASYGGSSVLGAEAFALPVGGRAVPSVWFAAYRRLFGLVDGRWVLLDADAGLPLDVFHAVAVDGAGRLWVGTRSAGLWRARRALTEADLDRWARTPADQLSEEARTAAPLFERVWASETGAPTDQVEALLRVGDDLWVATPAGLFVLGTGPGSAEVRATLGEAEGLPSVRVFSLAQSPTTGTLWVGTNGGLTEVDPATRRPVRTLTRQDGLVGNEVWYHGSVRADARGRVYFGTAQGLTVYTPTLDAPPAVPPRLHLRAADVVQRPSGYTEAEFRYAATHFADEQAVRYRYRLMGYDEAWSEPTAEPKVRYTNLPAYVVPRTYTLEVLAGTEGGAWTPRPLRHTFRVRPPWWLGAWAFLGYALALGVGVVAVDRFQRRRLVQRERERARLREAELEADAARAEQAATEARARALSAEAEAQAAELSKARELAEAFHRLEETHQNLVETQTQLVQQEKMASLGRLTAGVAHELKNPLNFVTNFARLSAELTEELEDLLADAGARPAPDVRDVLGDLRRNAETIEAHGRRADEIVRHMLLHSRGTSGPRRAVALNDVVADAVGLAERGRRAAEPDLDVRVSVVHGPEEVRVLAAPLELGRVLVNLFDNAFDAVRDRARTAGPDYAPAIEVTTERDGDRVCVHVADNGTGIPDDVVGKVFEPFFTTKPTGQGTGLGLSLSFDIVRQHQGVLSVAAREGGGTVFTVELPVAAPAPQGAAGEGRGGRPSPPASVSAPSSSG